MSLNTNKKSKQRILQVLIPNGEGECVHFLGRGRGCEKSDILIVASILIKGSTLEGKHLTRKSGVLGSIPGLATYFRFSFRFFKKGSCQLLAKVCARSTG